MLLRRRENTPDRGSGAHQTAQHREAWPPLVTADSAQGCANGPGAKQSGSQARYNRPQVPRERPGLPTLGRRGF